MSNHLEILSNPFGLTAFIVMLISWLAMGGLAKDHVGAKGLKAYLIVASAWGVLIYVRYTKEQNNKIGFLFWVFLVSVILLFAIEYSELRPNKPPS